MPIFLIMIITLVIISAGSFYLLTGKFVKGLGKNPKSMWIRVIRLLVSALVAVSCMLWRTVMVAMLYLFIIFLFMGILAIFMRRVLKSFNKGAVYSFLKKAYRFGVIHILLLAVILCQGFYTMNNLVKTEYTVTNEKIKNDYKVVFISDLHFDTIQNKTVIKNKIAEINELMPDIVILGGDIVEEGTSKQSMNEIFSILGGINSSYGKFFVYGNHDRQTYSANPSYTNADLDFALGVHSIFPLEDQSFNINNEILLVGRKDASVKYLGQSRQKVDSLLSNKKGNPFILLADHQPTEFEENEKAGVDLMVSGHTHGGQIFPVGRVAELLGIMKPYGESRVGSLTAIVSSGAAGWGFTIRTERSSEYLLINLVPKGDA